MDLHYFQVDAFTSRLFAGNPAGVCLLEAWLPDETLQSIAAENNQAETAFIVGREGNHDLRWFTPTTEVDLCGHATLAAAHVLFRHRGLEGDEVRFQTKSGELGVSRRGEVLVLDFPSTPATPCDPPGALVKGLGKLPIFTAKSRDFLAVYESEEDVRELKPDFAELSRLDSLGVIATAPGMECDFVSRFFAPNAGVNEDPVTISGRARTYLTGTIHLALARKAWLAGPED
jgi:predicted PhzF superfamily epimerase YddE/YHI9